MFWRNSWQQCSRIHSQKQSSDKSSDDEGDEIFSLSHHANEGVQGKKTIKLSGLVNHQEILILIDSGSFFSQSRKRLARIFIK